MEEKIMAKETLKGFKESIDAREKLLEKDKKNFFTFNLLYNLTSKDKVTDMIFEFRKEEMEQEQKNNKLYYKGISSNNHHYKGNNKY